MKMHIIGYVCGASQHLCLLLLLALMNTNVLAAAVLHINTADVCRCGLCSALLSLFVRPSVDCSSKHVNTRMALCPPTHVHLTLIADSQAPAPFPGIHSPRFAEYQRLSLGSSSQPGRRETERCDLVFVLMCGINAFASWTFNQRELWSSSVCERVFGHGPICSRLHCSANSPHN